MKSQEVARSAMETERDKIEAELHRIGVHDGFPDQRRAMSVALDIQGLTAADIALLADGVAAQRRRDSDGTPAIVAKLLGDTKLAAARVADMKRGRDLRQSAADGKSRAVYPGQSFWKQGIDWTEADRVRDRRVAYALLRVDRKTAREVAEVLGCTEEQAHQLAEEHAHERKLWQQQDSRPTAKKTREKD